MCIAIYVPTGKNIKDEQIRNAFKNNPDGAGVMHYDKYGRVHYNKGFMDVESLLAYWHHNTTDKYPRAIHCRIATSGKIGKGCCHPFPITNDLDAMLKPSGKSKTGCLIHNGVFAKYTPKDGMNSPYSDTMVFTQKVIYPLREVLNNSGVDELMSDMTSRVLVFLPNYEVHRYGKWEFEDVEGFYASNTTYDYDKDEWKKWYNNGAHYCSYLPYSYDNYGTTVYDSGSGKSFSLTSKVEEDKKQATDGYGIAFTARSMYEAEDMMYAFMDEHCTSLVDGGWDACETLEHCTDSDTWVFYVESFQDITNAIDKSKYIIYEHCKYDKDGNIIDDEVNE